MPESHRAIVVVHVTRVADSCGYGVPLMDYEGERPHQAASSAKRVRVHGPDAYVDYQREHNAASIDGLPAVELPEAARSLGARSMSSACATRGRPVDLPGDVDLVVLAVGADPPGAPEPPPEAELALLGEARRGRRACRRATRKSRPGSWRTPLR